MLHAYNPATGELIQVWGEPPIRYDLKEDEREAALAADIEVDADTIRLRADGCTVVQSAEPADPLTHYYLGDKLAPKTTVVLSCATPTINTSQEALVAVTVADPSLAEIALLVAGTEIAVALVGGEGALPPITGTTPCVVEVAVADTVKFKCESILLEVLDV